MSKMSSGGTLQTLCRIRNFISSHGAQYKFALSSN